MYLSILTKEEIGYKAIFSQPTIKKTLLVLVFLLSVQWVSCQSQLRIRFPRRGVPPNTRGDYAFRSEEKFTNSDLKTSVIYY